MRTERYSINWHWCSLVLMLKTDWRDVHAQPIYTHITTATDKDNVKLVFANVKEIVVRKSMEDAGLLLT